jgi:hypothetical protein
MSIVRTQISFVCKGERVGWKDVQMRKEPGSRKETGRVAEVACEPSLRRTTTRATRVRLQSGSAFVDLKTMTADVALAKTDLLSEQVVAAYTPITPMFQIEDHRRRDAELSR